MHLAEGILAPQVLAAGAVAGALGVGYGLRRMDTEDVPRVAVLSSAFFVASLIHVPMGPGAVHLVLNGLLGAVLGWAAFPAVVVALLLQALLFGFGGLTTLGVNTVIMAAPAVAVHYLFRRWLRPGEGPVSFLAGFAAGALALALGAALASLSLAASGRAFYAAAALLFSAHAPVMLVEGVVTGAVVGFLARVRPDILGLRLSAEGGSYGQA